MFSLSAPHRLCAPSFVLMASLAAVLLAAPVARAGTYNWQTTDPNTGQITARSPTYSGGTDSVVPAADGTAPPPMTPYNGPGWIVAPSGSSQADAQGNATSVTLKAQGPLNAKFTWQPAYSGEPAPTAVIIYQDSGAGLTNNRYGYFDASSTCTNGLGGSATFPTSSSVRTESYQYVGATPGADGSVSAPSVSPAASCTVSSGAGYGSYAAVAASVGYVATAYPVTINLSGTLTNSNGQPVLDSSGNQQILVGQGCKASLVGVPSGTGWGPTTYSWSVSGTTFQDWQPASSSNSQASFYDPGPGTQTNSTYHWYWNDSSQTTETVTCTAMVTPPAGQGYSFSVTATQKVGVYLPTINKNSNFVGAGYIAPYQPTYPLWMVAEPSASMKSLNYGEGSTWVTSVSMPSTPTFNGTGTYAYAQIIAPGETVTDINGVSHTGQRNGLEGLDGKFPYYSDTYPADGRQYNDGDSPALPVSDVEKSEQLTDTFHTYLMFMPPGSDSRWVPLAASLWLTNFNASLPSTGHWADFPSTQTVGPVSLGYDFVPRNTFPSWIRTF